MTRLVWALSSLNLLLWNFVSLLCLAPKTDFTRLMIICDKIKSYLLFNSIFGLRLLCNNITPNSNAITCRFNSLFACSRHKMVRKTWKRERSRKIGERALYLFNFLAITKHSHFAAPGATHFLNAWNRLVRRDLWAVSRHVTKGVTKERLYLIFSSCRDKRQFPRFKSYELDLSSLHSRAIKRL